MRDTWSSWGLVHSRQDPSFLSSDEFWSCYQAHLRKGSCCYCSIQPWKAHKVGPSFLILPLLVAIDNITSRGQNWTSLKKKSLPMTRGGLESGFFMPVKEIIHLPPWLVSSMPLQFFQPMENQKSKVSTNTVSKEIKRMCIFHTDGGQEGRQYVLKDKSLTPSGKQPMHIAFREHHPKLISGVRNGPESSPACSSKDKGCQSGGTGPLFLELKSKSGEREVDFHMQHVGVKQICWLPLPK